MNKKFLTGSGVILAVVLFFSVNVLSNVLLKSARWDLTDNHLYTLSQGTRNILHSLSEPITLRLYLSKALATSLPGINSYAIRVQELLEEFEQEADGRLTLLVIDPEPFSEEEDRAVGFGLQGVPVSSSNTLFYFGLVGTNSVDDEEVIPFFQPDREEFLEYDLAKLIYQLANPKQKVVGLLSTLPLDGAPPNPFMPGGGGQPLMIMDQIRQLFDVERLEPDITQIPDTVDVLMIVHPKHLSDPTLYAIDQFVLRGGRALIFVDPYAESDRGTPNPQNPMAALQQPKHSDLPKLFAKWGVAFTPDKVVADLPFSKKVNFRHQSRMQVADYPVWVDLPPSQLNPDDIITGQLPNLSLASAGFLTHIEGSQTELIPLVKSDQAAMRINASQLRFLTDVSSLIKTYKPENTQFVMAARITGHVETAFPDGPPPTPPGKDPSHPNNAKQDKTGQPPHLKESQEPINVIVVADTDMLQDRFWVQVQSFLGQRIGFPTAGNGSFVTNALDNLTGSNDLISIRSRGRFSRPFTLVRAIQQEAEQRFRQKEQQLQERLKATERKIQELQRNKPEGGSLILSPAQQEEMARFRQELVQTRKELRSVQHELQKDIERLESLVKFVNIGLMPLLITGGGMAFSLYRLKRRKTSP